jgi:hypothetical protein
MSSQDWTPNDTNTGVLDKGIKWIVHAILPWCNFPDAFILLCGTITDYRHGGHDSKVERVHIFRINEPTTFALIGIALIGLAFTRRRKQ